VRGFARGHHEYELGNGLRVLLFPIRPSRR
jgi:hypothetical protein